MTLHVGAVACATKLKKDNAKSFIINRFLPVLCWVLRSNGALCCALHNAPSIPTPYMKTFAEAWPEEVFLQQLVANFVTLLGAARLPNTSRNLKTGSYEFRKKRNDIVHKGFGPGGQPSK